MAEGCGKRSPALELEPEEALLTLPLSAGTARATGIVTSKGQDRKGLVSEVSRARPVRGRQTEHETTPTAKAIEPKEANGNSKPQGANQKEAKQCS